MPFKYFDVAVSAAPLDGGESPPANLAVFAQTLNERAPVVSSYTGDPLMDNTLLHQVFALKLKGVGGLEGEVVTTPVKVHHRWGIKKDGTYGWVEVSVAPASLIYEVPEVGYLLVHPR